MIIFHLAPQNLGHKEWPSHEGDGVEEEQARYVEDGVAKGELEGIPVFSTFMSYRYFFSRTLLAARKPKKERQGCLWWSSPSSLPR